MDIKAELLIDHGKETAIRISNWVGNDQTRMDKLMKVFFEGDYRMTQMAAYPLIFISDENPSLFYPYLPRMLEYMKGKVHDAVIRNTLRLFQFIDIPEEIEGELFDMCIHFFSSPKFPVAIRVFAMTILANTCKKYPELKIEVLPLVNDVLEISESPGIRSRGRKVLAELRNLPDV